MDGEREEKKTKTQSHGRNTIFLSIAYQRREHCTSNFHQHLGDFPSFIQTCVRDVLGRKGVLDDRAYLRVAGRNRSQAGSSHCILAHTHGDFRGNFGELEFS